MSAPRLICLLPARDSEHDLPGWFESVERFADAVVALDDGSSDGTRAALAGHPLVKVLLENPPRDTYAGWDDAANRNRLLDAAAELEPDWIVSLDADERLDAEDASALREFLVSDAITACAYGLQHFRMWGEQRYDPRFTWVYRLFPFRRGQRFPGRRLHFTPVPTDIPRSAWVRTTIRIRHLGAMSEERIEDRLAKYRQADTERVWPTDFGRLSERPRGDEDLPVWQPRPTDRPVLLPPGELTARSPLPGARRPKLVCLLPARNAEADLPGWFESVECFADAVVALDDGSSDGTRAALAGHPLVKVLLENPPRDTYAGWDDAANRNRLLDAAAELEPDWIVSLDADERLDAGDAATLREFVDGNPSPELAYGFRVCRMIDDLEHFDQDGLWVYRLFAYKPGQRFPGERLHFVPVPTSIDRRHFTKTTLRIQHVGALSEERRRERFAKYLEADPGNDYQRDYANLLTRPREVRRWEPRRPGTPLLAAARSGSRLEWDDAALDGDAPVLSAVIISRNDEDRIERAVRAVVDQDCPEPFEVIVVVSGSDRTAEIVRERFPSVRLIELEGEALPGRARNAGVQAARGEFVSFPGSHVELPQGSLAARVRAHQLGHAMVTGTILNGTRTRAGWANYFLDHSTALPGRPSGRLKGPPAHCSYIRDHLLAAGGFPEDMRAGEDTVMNVELHRRGLRAYRAQDLVLTHRSRCERLPKLLRHHFQRGRGMGRILLGDHRTRGGLLARAWKPFGVGYLSRRVGSTRANVERWGGELRAEYRRGRAFVGAAAVAALAGIWIELLKPGRGKARVLLGRAGRPQEARPGARRSARERFPREIELNAYVLPGRAERDPAAADELADQACDLTWASLFAREFTESGELRPLGDCAARQACLEGGARPLLVLANTSAGRFDTELAAALLSDRAAQERLLAEVCERMAEHDYGGLSLDFERLRPDDREPYNHFLRLAAEMVHAGGRVLATAVAPKQWGGERGLWHEAHDYRVHGEIADFVVVMAYEWRRPGGAPGPVAPLDGVRQVLRYALNEIPREKLMLAVPLYGYDWAASADGGFEAPSSLAPAEAARLAAAPGARLEYDEDAETARLSYRGSDGHDHVVWCEDARSLAAKLDLVRALGLRGLSFWRLPAECPEAWRLVDELFSVRRLAEPLELQLRADGVPATA